MTDRAPLRYIQARRLEKTGLEREFEPGFSTSIGPPSDDATNTSGYSTLPHGHVILCGVSYVDLGHDSPLPPSRN
jgi:hypothetical protein